MKKDKKIALDELEVVSGGTIIESYHVGFMLQDAGYNVFDADGKFMDMSKFRSVLKGMGFDKIEDHGGILEANKYSMGDKTFNNVELVDFLKSKGIKDAGITEYTNRWLKTVLK